jgi:hypothetical protein
VRFIAITCIAVLVLGTVACSHPVHTRVPRTRPESRACVQRCQGRYECVQSCPGAVEAEGDCPRFEPEFGVTQAELARRRNSHACFESTEANGGVILVGLAVATLLIFLVSNLEFDYCVSEGCGDR